MPTWASRSSQLGYAHTHARSEKMAAEITAIGLEPSSDIGVDLEPANVTSSLRCAETCLKV